MASRLPSLVFRLALLVAMAVSSALLIDYVRPLPAFCDVGSGCDKVRASGLGSILGIPLPLVGLVAFASLIALSLFRSEAARRATRALAALGGVLGIALLLTQALHLKFFCKLCVVVDIAAIVAAVAALLPSRPELASPPNARWLWPVASAFAVLLPGAWALVQPSPPVPPEIASLWVPGKINVVEFSDFQCPFCRQLHPRMVELTSEYRDRVNLVRLNVPLPGHSNALDAARAFCCADDQGKGEEMADALFASDDLSAEGCERLAASLGLSRSVFRACVESVATNERVERENQRARRAGLKGLPTVWIGDQVLIGLQPADKLRAAFVEAARGKPTQLPTAILWALLAGALAVFGAVAMRGRQATTAR